MDTMDYDMESSSWMYADAWRSRVQGLMKLEEIGYTLSGVIGFGGYGVVFKAMKNGVPVAIKWVDNTSDIQKTCCIHPSGQAIPKEIDLMTRISNLEGILHLLDWFQVGNAGYFMIFQSPNSAMDLFELISKEGLLSEVTAKIYFRNIVETIDNICKAGVFHRDLKSDNIVVDLDTNSAKIIDFGCGTKLRDGKYHKFNGTLIFMPPEWFLHKFYEALPATVWTLGCLLYEMVTGHLPFNSDNEIIAAQVTFLQTDALSDDCKNLIHACLAFDYNTRPALQDIILHPWLV